MKMIITFLMIFISLNVYAQKDDAYPLKEIKSTATIPKGSIKIIITNKLTAQENYTLTGKTILSSGYFIDKKDNELFYYKTQDKSFNKGRGIYFLNILCLDGKIEVSGMMRTGNEITTYGVTMRSEFNPIQFEGNNLYKEAFRIMDQFSSNLEGVKEYK